METATSVTDNELGSESGYSSSNKSSQNSINISSIPLPLKLPHDELDAGAMGCLVQGNMVGATPLLCQEVAKWAQTMTGSHRCSIINVIV